MSRRKTEVTFEDLKALAQKSRNPCGKRAYSLSQAQRVARDREKFEDKKWYVQVCFDGCGNEIFHLTTTWPGGKLARSLNARPERKKRQQKKNSKKRRKITLRPQICDWENEGGSYRD